MGDDEYIFDKQYVEGSKTSTESTIKPAVVILGEKKDTIQELDPLSKEDIEKYGTGKPIRKILRASIIDDSG